MRLSATVLTFVVSIVCASAGPIAQVGVPLSNGTSAPTAAISGSVVDGATNEPIAGAVVSASAKGRADARRSQVTDDRGRFVFPTLPAGEYALSAKKLGYLLGGEPNVGLGMSTAVIAERQWLSTVRLELWRPGAVSGTVVDEYGDPVVGATVWTAVHAAWGGSSRWAAGPFAKTDDRGQYRISSLPEGDYLVSVLSIQVGAPLGIFLPPVADARGVPQVYPMIHYPGAREVADALPVSVEAGQEKQGVDFRLMPVPSRRIAGRVEGPSEALAALTPLRLVSVGNDQLGIAGLAATAMLESDGRFTFPGIPAGNYVIEAAPTLTELVFRPNSVNAYSSLPLRPLPGFQPGAVMTLGGDGRSRPSTWGRDGEAASRGAGLFWARVNVEVADADIDGLVVRLEQGVRVNGVVEWDADASSVLRNIPFSFGGPGQSGGEFPLFPGGIAAEPASADTWLGEPMSTVDNKTHAFMFDVIPGEYYLRLSDTRGATAIKSVMWKGHDYAWRPLDISGGSDGRGLVVTITDKLPVFTGVVRDSRGMSVEDATVVYFPVDQTAWLNQGYASARIGAVRVNSLGMYSINDRQGGNVPLPAGEYYLVPVRDAQHRSWRDVRFLEAASRTAVRAAVGWGERKTLDLTLRDLPRE